MHPTQHRVLDEKQATPQCLNIIEAGQFNASAPEFTVYDIVNERRLLAVRAKYSNCYDMSLTTDLLGQQDEARLGDEGEFRISHRRSDSDIPGTSQRKQTFSRASEIQAWISLCRRLSTMIGRARMKSVEQCLDTVSRWRKAPKFPRREPQISARTGPGDSPRPPARVRSR